MTIHFINPFRNAAGGSEWRILTLYDELKKYCNVKLWAHIDPDKRLSTNYPIRKINTFKASFPKSGVIVFVGNYLPGKWIKFSFPSRVILLCNTYNPRRFANLFNFLSENFKQKVELVFASKLLMNLIGKQGIVQPSLIDINKFYPFENKNFSTQDFTIGRLSRDVPQKHHSDDLLFYQKLSEFGCKIKIMGGTYLSENIRATPNIKLLPVLAEESNMFLHSLDCFYYRTAESYIETYARVVFEALASGLPVVCHKNGGYADSIENGINGFLFDTESEAFNIIMNLKNDIELRKKIGFEARKLAEKIYGTEGKQQIINYYLSK